MAEITAQMIKELRELTQAGMMECRNALKEADGDMEGAKRILEEKGKKIAAKKATKTAAEGKMVVRVEGNVGVLLEINSQTDFAARQANFLSFCDTLGDELLKAAKADPSITLEAFMSKPYPGSEGIAAQPDIETARQALVGKIGENIQVRRLEVIAIEEGHLGHYCHGDKIGVLLHLQTQDHNLAKDVCMHIAACSPSYLDSKQIPEALLEAEKTALNEKSLSAEEIDQALKQFFVDNCLFLQSFVKNPDITVGQLVRDASSEINRFIRYEVGEGIEVEKTSFADEVKAQVKESQN